MNASDNPPAHDDGPPASASDVWFLSGATQPGEPLRHIAVDDHPYVVGRRPGVSLSLRFRTVSGAHASLWVEDGALWLRDLGSTNGTYLNGQRVEETIRVGEEDLIHFAEAPFRVRRQSPTAQLPAGTIAENVCDQALALVQFDRLMSKRLVVPHFQPIVRLVDATAVGHEVLGRGRVFGLESVGAMFHAAAQLNLEVELSRVLRWEGVRVGRDLPDRPTLFVNTHPAELASDGLMESIRRLKAMAGGTGVVLEIHEAAITQPAAMRAMRDELQELGVGLAYDDFGAGQARLSELVEARPDYVKFDISLIRGIDRAGSERVRMLQSLVAMVQDLEIMALAEGIETAEEADACRAMGFELGQGFYYGHPAPAEIGAL